MAADDRRPISSAGDEPPKWTVLLCLLLHLLLVSSPAAAQQSPGKPEEDDQYSTSVSPALAILVVAIVSAFFLLGFFSVYLRRCAGDHSAVAPAILAGIGGGRSRRGAQRGLDPAVLEKFPTMVYSAVKGHKLGKETLECAVCLCEFQDDDILRLLPRCNHVFHRDCIDVWLATHVTCPVCRSNLDVDDPPSETDNVIIAVDNEAEEVSGGTDREAELADLVRIGSQRREAAARSRSGSVRRMPPRSTPSTVYWAAAVSSGGDGRERFTLRLPENVRREILAAGLLRRSASFAVFPARGEGSSRRGYREGASRPWRSLRLGPSGRWPFLGRSFSARGRGEATPEGSSKGREATPVKGISGSLHRGGGAGRGGKPGDGESSSAAVSQDAVLNV